MFKEIEKEKKRLKALNLEGLEKEITEKVAIIKKKMKGEKINGYGYVINSDIDEWTDIYNLLFYINQKRKNKRKIPFNKNILNLF